MSELKVKAVGTEMTPEEMREAFRQIRTDNSEQADADHMNSLIHTGEIESEVNEEIRQLKELRDQDLPSMNNVHELQLIDKWVEKNTNTLMRKIPSSLTKLRDELDTVTKETLRLIREKQATLKKGGRYKSKRKRRSKKNKTKRRH